MKVQVNPSTFAVCYQLLDFREGKIFVPQNLLTEVWDPYKMKPNDRGMGHS